jgi:hypothetical protein
MAAVAAVQLLPAAAQTGPWKTVDNDRWCGEGAGKDADRYCEVREITLPADGKVIRVDAGANGGIEVEGWNRDEIRLRVKVQAWSKDDDEARESVETIEIVTGGAVIHAEGPKQKHRQGWSVSFRLMVPEKSDLELEASNGGLAVTGVEGDIELDTTNGGLALSNVAGDVRGNTTNGGVHVELSGNTWRGGGLDLRSTNGGVDLEIPARYSAELETGTVNGGIKVDFPITVQGRIGKSLTTTLGGGGPRVRVKTVNGGVRISRI